MELVILAMERSENEPMSTEGIDGSVANHWVWLHLSSQLIYFILFQFASFPHIVMVIHDKVSFEKQKFPLNSMYISLLISWQVEI